MILAALRHRPGAGLAAVAVTAAAVVAVAAVTGPASPATALLVVPAVGLGVVAAHRALVVGTLTLVACSFVPVLVHLSAAQAVDLVRSACIGLGIVTVAAAVAVLEHEARRLDVRLARETTHDPLTGLLNRRGWQEGLDREHARATRRGVLSSVVALDLDGLKRVNETGGSRAGDDLIRATAARLRETFRDEDLLARLGGDEFAVLLVGADVDQAMRSTERLRAAAPAGQSFSAGVAAIREGEHPVSALARADQALYRAKSVGGGTSLPVDTAQAQPETVVIPAPGPAVEAPGGTVTEVTAPVTP